MRIVPVLPAGTTVKMTKVVSFDDESKVKVGDVLSGKLKSKTGVNQPILFENGANTNPVVTAKKSKHGDYIVNTGSEVYFMQIVK